MAAVTARFRSSRDPSRRRLRARASARCSAAGLDQRIHRHRPRLFRRQGAGARKRRARSARAHAAWSGNVVAMAADELGEFERIRRFFAPLAGPGGLGLLDDAALVDCGPGHSLVVTADAIVAGVHYLPEDPPHLVAKKLLRVNLSDLAAMGARPLHYLLTTALPAELGAEWIAGFARGLEEDQRCFGVGLLGGDSVSTAGPAVLSLTAVGDVEEGMEIRRSGARAGDVVWVSGTIGDAFLGLLVLRGAHPDLAEAYRAALTTRFQVPEPRVA